jgi:RNA polymerase sigma factor (sigma-70 family)
MDEQQLIQGIQQGDQEAVNQLLATYTQPLCYFSKKMVGNYDEAMDIAINSLMVFIKRCQDGKIATANTLNLRGFLLTIVRNKSIDAFRARKRTEAKIKEYYISNSEEDTIERYERQAYILEKLYAEIEKLPEGRKQIFKLYFLEGLSLDEIAQRNGIAYATAKNQKYEALKTIRSAFNNDEWSIILLLISLGAFSLN